MKMKFCLLVGAIAVLALGTGNFALAQKKDDNQGLKPGSSLGGGKYVAIIITPEEAAKKYPPTNGKPYPNGMDEGVLMGSGSAAHTGYIKSPFSSRVYDCRKIGTGTLLLDDTAKKVFLRPQTR